MNAKHQTDRRKTSKPEGYTTTGPRAKRRAATIRPKTARAQETSRAAFSPVQEWKGRDGREEPARSVGAVERPQPVLNEPPGAGLVIKRTGDRNFVVLVSNRFALVVAVFVLILLALKPNGQLSFIADLLKTFK